MLLQLAGIGSRLEVWQHVESGHHVEGKGWRKLELESHQLDVLDHVREQSALLGGVEGDGDG